MKRLLLFAVGLAACVHGPPDRPDADRDPVAARATVTDASVALADHHVHIFGPAVRHWLETDLGVQPLPPLGLEELMAILKKDNVAKAAVLSNAYFFAKDTAKQPHDTQQLMLENDRVAAAIARYPQQLAGFFSVNPLADTAFAEIERCARRGVFAGLKLHLANSEVDLRDRSHVQRLAAVFARANASRLAIVIHLRTQRADYGREDARIFIDQVLSSAPHVAVQIAHLAGWGGYDVATDSALSAFAERAAEIDPAQDNVYFDVSAVVRAVRESAAVAQTSEGSAYRNWWPE
jgi:uncharacterized protein